LVFVFLVGFLLPVNELWSKLLLAGGPTFVPWFSSSSNYFSPTGFKPPSTHCWKWETAALTG